MRAHLGRAGEPLERGVRQAPVHQRVPSAPPGPPGLAPCGRQGHPYGGLTRRSPWSTGSVGAMPGAVPRPRIGVLVVAYNAASSLAGVLDRIPSDFRQRITTVMVFDDHSDDSTYLVGLGYQQVTSDLPLEVIRHPQNLGYGGNQKAGYRWAIEHGLDIVVLLHGDGQYAPELLPEMVAPLETGRVRRGLRLAHADRRARPATAACRSTSTSATRSSPGSRTRPLGTQLSEFHSGYRAYRVDALDAAPVDALLRRVRLRHGDHHRARRRRDDASWRSRSRPTTATRSAT